MGTIRNIRKYEKKAELSYRKRLVQHEKEVTKIIDKTIEDVGKQIHLLQGKQELEPTKFIAQIKRNKLIKKQLKSAQVNLYKDLNKVVIEQVKDEWNQARAKGDKIEQIYLGNESAIATKLNTEALNAFISRKIKGITLSDRLWNVSKSTQTIIEEHIGTGITQGKSARRIVKDLYNSFDNPTSLLKSPRVKGQYKNVKDSLKRLVVTETNGAYRKSDVFRMQELDFVVGYKVSLSADHPRADICDSLQGVYPKTFIWDAWHPRCRCVLTSILQSKADFRNKVPAKYITKLPIQTERYALTYGNNKLKNAPWVTNNFTNKLKLKSTSGIATKNIKKYTQSQLF